MSLFARCDLLSRVAVRSAQRSPVGVDGFNGPDSESWTLLGVYSPTLLCARVVWSLDSSS